MDNIQTLLTGQKLQALISKSQELNRINQALTKILAPEIASACFAAKFENGELLLMTQSPAIASQIRFTAQQMIAELSVLKITQGIRKLHCLVSPKLSQMPSKKRQAQKPTKKTAENLSELSESVSDQDLKIALKHLAETIKT